MPYRPQNMGLQIIVWLFGFNKEAFRWKNDKVAILLVLMVCCSCNTEETAPQPHNFVDSTAASAISTAKHQVKKKGKKLKARGSKKVYKKAEENITPEINYVPNTDYSTVDYNSSSDCPSQQCRGTTKKGSRCRNMTRSCNGYCWRHGG